MRSIILMYCADNYFIRQVRHYFIIKSRFKFIINFENGLKLD